MIRSTEEAELLLLSAPNPKDVFAANIWQHIAHPVWHMCSVRMCTQLVRISQYRRAHQIWREVLGKRLVTLAHSISGRGQPEETRMWHIVEVLRSYRARDEAQTYLLTYVLDETIRSSDVAWAYAETLHYPSTLFVCLHLQSIALEILDACGCDKLSLRASLKTASHYLLTPLHLT